MKYEIKFDNGDPLIYDGQGYFLIDTGLPGSFSTTREIHFGGQVYPVGETCFNCNVDAINMHVDTPVIGAIGMNILSQYNVLIDYASGSIDTDCNCDVLEGWTDEGSEAADFGLVTTIQIDGHPKRIILDTGAANSYLLPELAQQFPLVGVIHDVSWNGSFTSPAHAFTFECLGKKINATVGEMPSYVEDARANNIVGVFGTVFFNNFKVIIDHGHHIYIHP